MAVVSINVRRDLESENLSNRDLVGIYRRQAITCQSIVDQLERVKQNNADFFIQTGGFDQLKMHEDEAKRRMEMANTLEDSL